MAMAVTTNSHSHKESKGSAVSKYKKSRQKHTSGKQERKKLTEDEAKALNLLAVVNMVHISQRTADRPRPMRHKSTQQSRSPSPRRIQLPQSKQKEYHSMILMMISTSSYFISLGSQTNYQSSQCQSDQQLSQYNQLQL